MDELNAMRDEMLRDYRRQLTAEFMLGVKGEHLDGDEWERMADYWDGRCSLAEAKLAQVLLPEVRR